MVVFLFPGVFNFFFLVESEKRPFCHLTNMSPSSPLYLLLEIFHFLLGIRKLKLMFTKYVLNYIFYEIGHRYMKPENKAGTHSGKFLLDD